LVFRIKYLEVEMSHRLQYWFHENRSDIQRSGIRIKSSEEIRERESEDPNRMWAGLSEFSDWESASGCYESESRDPKSAIEPRIFLIERRMKKAITNDP
jgi:hypothetical protein